MTRADGTTEAKRKGTAWAFAQACLDVQDAFDQLARYDRCLEEVEGLLEDRIMSPETGEEIKSGWRYYRDKLDEMSVNRWRTLNEILEGSFIVPKKPAKRQVIAELLSVQPEMRLLTEEEFVAFPRYLPEIVQAVSQYVQELKA